MNIFDDKHVLILVFVVLGVFISATLLFILLTEGLEATVLPAVLFPALILFLFLIVKGLEGEQREYKGIASGVWSGFWFTEFAFVLALALSVYVILTSQFIKNTFFEHQAQQEEIVPGEYRASSKYD